MGFRYGNPHPARLDLSRLRQDVAVQAAENYLVVLDRLNRRYEQRDGVAEAVARFDVEYPNIRRGLDVLLKLKGGSSRALGVCGDYFMQRNRLVQFRLPLDKSIEWYHTALTVLREYAAHDTTHDTEYGPLFASPLGVLGWRIAFLTTLGELYCQSGEYARGCESLREAVVASELELARLERRPIALPSELAESCGPDYDSGVTAGGWADVGRTPDTEQQTRYEQPPGTESSRTNTDPAVSEVADLRRVHLESAATLSRYFAMRGEMEKAELLAQYVLKNVGDPPSEPARVLAMDALVIVALARENYLQALNWSRIAQQAAEDAGDHTLAGHFNYRLAWCQLYLGEVDAAVNLWTEAKRRCDETGETQLSGMILVSLGRAASDQGDPERGVRLCLDGLSLIRSTGALFSELKSLVLLGGIYQRQRQPAEAERCLLSAAEIASAIDNKLAERTLYGQLAQMKSVRAEYATASLYAKRAYVLATESASASARHPIGIVLAESLVRLDRFEEAIEQYGRCVRDAEEMTNPEVEGITCLLAAFCCYRAVRVEEGDGYAHRSLTLLDKAKSEDYPRAVAELRAARQRVVSNPV